MARGRASSLVLLSWSLLLGAVACGGEQVEPVSKPTVAPLPSASSSAPPVASSGSSDNVSQDAPHVVELPGVDTSELLTSEKARFTELVEGTNSPCGEAFTLDVCLLENRGCNLCLPAAQTVAKLVAQGEYKGDIRAWLDHRFFDEGALKTIEVGNSPSTGPVKAPLQIIEFADFECPACGRAAPALHDLLADGGEFANKIRLVFKHMPLKAHAHAEQAARAAWAAQQQGKFWPMHGLLFAHQDALEASDLEGYAKTLGLDVKRFRVDMESKKAKDRVAEDYALGDQVGLTATPTLFINKRKFVAIGPDEFGIQLARWLRWELMRIK
jgi:predicted DsbA family dithiol-disulfide isomerase